MSVNDMIKNFPTALNAEAAADLNVTIQYKTSNPAYLEIKDGQCTVHDGVAASADVTLTMEDEDLAALLKGELNGMTAFMTGKLQVDGDLMLAQRLPTLFDPAKL